MTAELRSRKSTKLPDQSWRAVVETAKPDEVEGYLIDEICKAMGVNPYSVWRKFIGLFFLPVIRSFIKKANEFDQSVEESGLKETAQTWLGKWTPGVEIHGIDEIPRTGSLIIAANHPGTFDGLAIAACLPREDLKIIAAANPFFRILPRTRQHFIYSTLDTFVRASTIREAIRHLKKEGALLVFSSGSLDPDPFYFPDAAKQAVERWSNSLEFFLQKVPETKVVVAISSAFVAPEFLNHPLVKLRSNFEARQKLAEFSQVIQMVLLDRRVSTTPCVAFAKPVGKIDPDADSSELHGLVIALAQQLINRTHRGIISPKPIL